MRPTAQERGKQIITYAGRVMTGEGEFRSAPQTADRQGATEVLDLDAVEDRERINAQIRTRIGNRAGD